MRLHARRSGRLRGHDGRDQAGAVLSLERLLARGHLVEHGAEREDVGARVGGRAFELLGGHVLERPHDRALLGEGLVDGVVGLDGGDRLDRAACARRGQAEVEELRARTW